MSCFFSFVFLHSYILNNHISCKIVAKIHKEIVNHKHIENLFLERTKFVYQPGSFIEAFEFGEKL